MKGDFDRVCQWEWVVVSRNNDKVAIMKRRNNGAGKLTLAIVAHQKGLPELAFNTFLTSSFEMTALECPRYLSNNSRTSCSVSPVMATTTVSGWLTRGQARLVEWLGWVGEVGWVG